MWVLIDLKRWCFFTFVDFHPKDTLVILKHSNVILETFWTAEISKKVFTAPFFENSSKFRNIYMIRKSYVVKRFGRFFRRIFRDSDMSFWEKMNSQIFRYALDGKTFRKSFWRAPRARTSTSLWNWVIFCENRKFALNLLFFIVTT